MKDRKLPEKDDAIQLCRFLTNHIKAEMRVMEEYAEKYTTIVQIACGQDRIEMQNTIYAHSRYIGANKTDIDRDFLAVRTPHFRAESLTCEIYAADGNTDKL